MLLSLVKPLKRQRKGNLLAEKDGQHGHLLLKSLVFKEKEYDMQYLFVVLSFVVATAAMFLIKTLDLNAWLTASLVLPLVLLVIYSMARIESKEESLKRETGK